MIDKINMNDLTRSVSEASFVLLFPGFFFYHFAVGYKIIPPILGGYFGIVALFLFFPLFFLNLKFIVIEKHLPVYLFYAILFLTLIITVFHFFFQVPDNFVIDMFFWSMSGLLFNVVSFLIASKTPVKEKISLFYLLVLFLMFLIVVLNVGEKGFFDLKEKAVDVSDNVSTYQGFARSIVVLLLISVAITFQKGLMFYLVFVIGSITLFFNGARTEFALFVLSVLFFYTAYSLIFIKDFFLWLFLIMFFALILFYIVDILPHSRMFQLLDISESSSGQRRLELFVNGIKLILKNPLVGSYGGYTNFGGIGSYPHNILSAWVNLGLIGIGLYVFMFLLLWKDALIGFLKKEHRRRITYKVFLMYLFFVTGALLFSKDYSYMLVGLLLGFYSQYKKDQRNLCRPGFVGELVSSQDKP